ncbi:hypothetical protein QFX18_00010 [Saccharophagus degradans]|uniref:hypothetical protein n=1 Tax=Saccharophagus degradans TaxID=86304 RepID=UPI002478232C|nr:hypothetical protein [Saccharophagus degradans]WGO98446.1 hypothetical protein QFX18_00010 [Saccharophagus degradans]
MSKFEQVHKLIFKELDSFFSHLDVAVGQIKRQSRYDDTFETGQPISEIVEVSLVIAEHFSTELLSIYSKRSKPLLVGIEKFDNQCRETIVQVFFEFSKYCLTVLEEASKNSKQPHLYGKEYPGLHKSLEVLQYELSKGVQ